MSLGCFPSGQTWAAFNDGLTSTMISKISGVSGSCYTLVNGFCMFQLLSGMTLESCTSICLSNSFVFIGIGGFEFSF